MYNQAIAVIPEFFYREISEDFDLKSILGDVTTSFGGLPKIHITP